MSAVFSPLTLAFAGILAIVAVPVSSNAVLWAVSVLALPLAVYLAGGKQAYRVLLWLIALNWLTVIGDIVSANLTGHSISEGWRGPYEVKAIIWSLCAILALALGMRWGTRLWLFRSAGRTDLELPTVDKRDISLNRIIPSYFVSLIMMQILGFIAASAPTIAQPILALTLVKFACVYLLAAKVFESDQGYVWLLLVLLLETVSGLTGFFSAYKEAFFLTLIALASSRRPLSPRMWILGITTVIVVAWISLFWTAVKKEYRYHVFQAPIEQRLEWMGDRFLSDSVNYNDAVKKLFERLGYTKFFAQVIARQDTGSLPTGFNFYASAVLHVLAPRVLFSDKPTLNDSKVTTALLGLKIPSETSISVGYIAQAYVDFGFPELLLPMLMIGVLIGAAAKYFMTRPAPLLIREAFMTATLFLVFSIGQNIDKSLGGFVVDCLVMGLVLKLGHPMIARWLTGSVSPYSGNSVGKIRA